MMDEVARNLELVLARIADAIEKSGRRESDVAVDCRLEETGRGESAGGV